MTTLYNKRDPYNAPVEQWWILCSCKTVWKLDDPPKLALSLSCHIEKLPAVTSQNISFASARLFASLVHRHSFGASLTG